MMLPRLSPACGASGGEFEEKGICIGAVRGLIPGIQKASATAPVGNSPPEMVLDTWTEGQTSLL